MPIQVLVLTQDPRVVDTYPDKMMFLENCNVENQDFFLRGPVTRQLVVLDFKPNGSGLSRGVRFSDKPYRQYDGQYVLTDPKNYEARDFLLTNVFGIVACTMEMFMEKDVLGRPLTWAFEVPQLFIIPRAGEWANAFYERESHSLQFYYFPSSIHQGYTIYTALSHDIVSHKTAHAILDGVARDIYNAITPQSLALHEVIADLTAVVMAFRCEQSRSFVLTQPITRIIPLTTPRYLALSPRNSVMRTPRAQALATCVRCIIRKTSIQAIRLTM